MLSAGVKEIFLTVRPTADYKALPLPRPGGSSFDVQWFEDAKTGERWIGKCDRQAASHPHARSPCKARYYDEYKEWLGFALYRLCGIPVPKVALSLQQVQKPAGAPDEPAGMEADYDYTAPCLHILSQFVEGLQTCGADYARSQRDYFPILPAGSTTPIPLRGFGAVLAVANFIYDGDCVGRGGKNISYVLERDAKDEYEYAKVVKIDAGCAFSFLENYARKDQEWLFSLHFDELTQADQTEFIETAKRILVLPWAAIEATVHQTIHPDGLTSAQAQTLLQRLLDRKLTFLNAFYPEVEERLSAEAGTLHAQVQREREQVLVRRSDDSKSELKSESKAPVVISSTTAVTSTSALTISRLTRKEQAAADLKSALDGTHRVGSARETEASASTPSRLFQCPSVTADFTGREAALQSIADALHRQKGGVISQGICGPGGVGKTQLASHYVALASCAASCGIHRLRYDAILWLYAERDLASQMRTLAEVWFGIRDLSQEETLAAVARQLSCQQVLIVLDDAEEAASILPILATVKSLSAHILITSRSSAWNDIPLLTLEGFSLEEGAAYVKKHLPTATSEEITALLTTVSHLPLALAHTAAYIKAGFGSIQIYLRDFARHQLSLSGNCTVSVSSQTVMTTFLLTLKRLLPSYPATDAILKACAYLAPEGIPLTLLRAGLIGTTPDTYSTAIFERSLTALIEQSLLQRIDPGRINIHRLVQRAVQSYQRQLEGTTGVRRHLTRWVQCFDTRLQYDDKNRADVLRVSRLIPHAWALAQACTGPYTIEAAPLGMLFHRIGYHQQYGIGAYREAQHAFRQLLPIVEAHYPANHPDVAKTLVNLANTLRNLGDASAARPLLERALPIAEKHYSAGHPQIAKILVNLANTLWILGDARAACPLLKRALVIKEKLYPADHLEVAKTLVNLANALQDLGDASAACPLLERALAVMQKHYAASHPEIAKALGNLAKASWTLGNIRAARPLLEKALAIKEKLYPADHPEVAKTLMNLANTLQDLGDTQSARPLVERAHRIFLANFGATHLHTQVAIRALAALPVLSTSAASAESKAAIHLTTTETTVPAAVAASSSSSSTNKEILQKRFGLSTTVQTTVPLTMAATAPSPSVTSPPSAKLVR